MKRFGWFLVAAAVAIAAWVTLRRARERAELEEEWDAEMPAAVGVDEATFVSDGPLVDEDVPSVVEAPPEEVDEDATQEAPPLHTDRDSGELRDQIAESRQRMRDKARLGRRGKAEPDAGEPEAG